MEGTISDLILLLHSFQPPLTQCIDGGICNNNILYLMIRKSVLLAVCLKKLISNCINLLLSVVLMLMVHPSLPYTILVSCSSKAYIYLAY